MRSPNLHSSLLQQACFKASRMLRSAGRRPKSSVARPRARPASAGISSISLNLVLMALRFSFTHPPHPLARPWRSWRLGGSSPTLRYNRLNSSALYNERCLIIERSSGRAPRQMRNVKTHRFPARFDRFRTVFSPFYRPFFTVYFAVKNAFVSVKQHSWRRKFTEKR
jgi:hypothetical protein